MITADNLKRLSTLDTEVLTGLVMGAYAKRKDKYKTARFLGLTNGGEFCYLCTFTSGDDICTTKVFVKLDPATDRVSATAG